MKILLLLVLSAALLPGLALAEMPDADDSGTLVPATIMDSSSLSGAEVDAYGTRAAEVQAAWLRELRDEPSNPLLKKADRRNAFPGHPEKMRCWVSGISAGIGVQTGVCKSAGRKYAFSALAFGPGADLHFGRLRLVADRPFPEDGLHATGGHEWLHILVGIETYDLTNQDGMNVKGMGFGAGLGLGIEFIWIDLARLP